MHEKGVCTSDRILLAALQLMQDKGFKSVTIRDIAVAADVSEMTVFRHFGTKKGVLEAAVKQYSYIPGFRKVFEEKVIFELVHDLTLIATLFLDLMEQNRAIYLIAIQERTTMPELIGLISENTKQLQELLTAYFKKMQRRKKMMDCDPSRQAIVFLTMYYGYFSSTALWEDQFIRASRIEFIQSSVAAFGRGLERREDEQGGNH